MEFTSERLEELIAQETEYQNYLMSPSPGETYGDRMVKEGLLLCSKNRIEIYLMLRYQNTLKR